MDIPLEPNIVKTTLIHPFPDGLYQANIPVGS